MCRRGRTDLGGVAGVKGEAVLVQLEDDATDAPDVARVAPLLPQHLCSVGVRCEIHDNGVPLLPSREQCTMR